MSYRKRRPRSERGARPKRHAPDARQKELARRVEAIRAALCGRRLGLVKYKPSNPVEIVRRIRMAVQKNRPLQLIVFWGGAKTRETRKNWPDRAEESTLLNIAEVRQQLEQFGLAVEVNILAMDNYELMLNQRTTGEVAQYVSGMIELTDPLGFRLERLSNVYHRRGFNPDRLKPSERKMREYVHELYDRVKKDEDIMGQLTRLAKLRQSRDPEEAVRQYVVHHAFDDFLLERTYPGAVYASLGNPKTQREISNLPTIFYYQNKEPGKIGEFGVPWFAVKPNIGK